MWVIVGCIVLVLAGLVAAVRWGDLTVEPPAAPAPEDPADAPERAPMGLVGPEGARNVHQAMLAAGRRPGHLRTARLAY